MCLLYTRRPVTECFYNGKQAYILNIGENFESGIYYEYFKNITNKLNFVWNDVEFNNVTFEDEHNILCRIIEMSPPSIIGQACAAAYNRVVNKQYNIRVYYMYCHFTLRKYTLALLNYLNDLSIQTVDSNKNLIEKKIPFVYGSIEKFMSLDTNSEDQIIRGNLNTLPRGYVRLDAMNRDEMRITNKNIKINSFKGDFTQQYSYNKMPYNFTYTVEIMTRGMNDASCIMEEICTAFNPNLAFDIYDADNLDSPTRIPVKLIDCNVSTEDYEELSANIATITCTLELNGYFYPPIKEYSKIKELLLNTHLGVNGDENPFNHDLFGWDVIETKTANEYHTNKEHAAAKLRILNLTNVTDSAENLNPEKIYKGTNELKLQFEYFKNTEPTVSAVCLTGNATVSKVQNDRIFVLTTDPNRDTIIECKVNDMFDNEVTFTKTFTA